MTEYELKQILSEHKNWLDDGSGKCANLIGADLSDADLSGANLFGADLSGAIGLVSPSDYLSEHFERTEYGYVVYKSFGSNFRPPETWDISFNSIITETVNACRTNDCGCGINVAPLELVKRNFPKDEIYKLIIKWEWLPGVVVPYNTDGKIRCERAMIIGKVK